MDFRAILLISHDRYFLDRVCNVMLVFEGKDQTGGGHSDYLSVWSSPAAHSGSNKNDKREELLLVETQISRLLVNFTATKWVSRLIWTLTASISSYYSAKKNC